jgi:hypothetical protein
MVFSGAYAFDAEGGFTLLIAAMLVKKFILPGEKVN